VLCHRGLIVGYERIEVGGRAKSHGTSPICLMVKGPKYLQKSLWEVRVETDPWWVVPIANVEGVVVLGLVGF